jgi:PAS domain S-box-containing protein
MNLLSHAPIFGANTQEAVNVWNKNAQKLVGYTPKEGLWKILDKEFITHEYNTVVQAVLDQAFQGEETGNFEFPLMIEVGVHLDALLNTMTRCDEQGNISGVVSIGQDITGQLAQEQEYRYLVDTANALIFGVDTLGCMNLWNKSASRFIGYSTEEVMGCSLVQEFITNDFKTAVQAVLVKTLKGDETKNFEFPLFTKSGTHIEFLLNAMTRQDEQENVFSVVGIGQDIIVSLVQEVEYLKLIDTENALIFGADMVGRVNVWN